MASNEIKQAVKFFIGVQLISENGEDVCSSSLVSGRNKMIINNLTKRCEDLAYEFWDNMTNEQQVQFNSVIKLIEDEI